jgi:DNA-binding transcriptional MerR regulator
MQGLSIGKLAGAANVSADTIRFYERRGLLSPPERSKSGYRRYTEHQLHQLLVIREAQSIGFTLEHIAELFALPGEDLAHRQSVLQHQLDIVDRKIAQLQRWKAALARLLEVPAARSESERSGVIECLMQAAVAASPADEHDVGGKSHATK